MTLAINGSIKPDGFRFPNWLAVDLNPNGWSTCPAGAQTSVRIPLKMPLTRPNRPPKA